MFKKYLATLGLVAMTALSGQVSASPVWSAAGNGGFESGFSGYFASMPGSQVVTSTVAHSGAVYNPTEGDYFAKIDSNAGSTCSFVGAGDCSMVSSLVQMEKGNTLQFNWAFLTENHTSVNDFGLLMLNADQTVLADVQSVGNHGDTGWQTFSWTADEDFTGLISWIAATPGTATSGSSLLVDNAQVLPEPGTIALLGLGLLGMAMSRRRKSM